LNSFLNQRRNQHQAGGRQLALPATCFMLVSWLILRPWRWRRHVPPKRPMTFTWLHDIFQKIKLFITTAPRSQIVQKHFVWTCIQFVLVVMVVVVFILMIDRRQQLAPFDKMPRVKFCNVLNSFLSSCQGLSYLQWETCRVNVFLVKREENELVWRLCLLMVRPLFPLEQIVYVPCLMKVIAPDKLVRCRRLGVKKVRKDVLLVQFDLTLLNQNRLFYWF
jgi:hypothetical protein